MTDPVIEAMARAGLLQADYECRRMGNDDFDDTLVIDPDALWTKADENVREINRRYAIAAKTAHEKALADAGMVIVPRDFVEEVCLMATNHGGWFDRHGFEALKSLYEKSSAILNAASQGDGM